MSICSMLELREGSLKSEIESVSKALGEPVATDFSDYVRKIRNGLLAISIISIIILLGDLKISSESSFLGLKFEGLDDDLILWVIFCFNSYLFAHFLWCGFDSFQEWRLRVTGTRVMYQTGTRFATPDCDYPNDPRQSTLYNWWKEEARKISSFQAPLEHIDDELKAWKEKVEIALKKKDPNVVSACMSINGVSENINKLMKSVENASKTIESNRIPASLKRFDSCFQLFLRSQNLRWLLIEFLFPLLLGFFALILFGIKFYY